MPPQLSVARTKASQSKATSSQVKDLGEALRKSGADKADLSHTHLKSLEGMGPQLRLEARIASMLARDAVLWHALS